MSSDTEELVLRIALALREEARGFHNPVDLYVEPEAAARKARVDPSFDEWNSDENRLESWKILARAALKALKDD